MITKTKNFQERGRHSLYLVLDCETATLPFANEIALNAEQKKKIAIAKPLIYDISWAVMDSDLNIYSKHSYLVTETFAVPAVFNTAYYKDKRPIYFQRLADYEIELKSWAEIVSIFQEDLDQIDFVCAYNAMFDFKKAIPFTDLYISKIYSNNYQEWEKTQKLLCQSMISDSRPKKSENEFDPENFSFREMRYPIIDIWGVSCESIINTAKFKRQCLENRMITESGKFFKTSAEASFRYIMENYGFEESHTAIDDVEIESFILYKALKKGKVPKGIISFPFNGLGTTFDFLEKTTKGIKKEHFDYVIEIVEKKLETYTKFSSFVSQLQSALQILEYLRDDRF